MHVLMDRRGRGVRHAPSRTKHHLWAACLLCLAACHANPHVPGAGRAALQDDGAALTTEPDASAHGQIYLSATDLRLPAPTAQATTGEQQFYAAATRAVRHVYEDDIDDPSQLQALRQRLSRDQNLLAAQSVWQPVLEQSLRRAQVLRALGPTLRALRQALAGCWRDEMSRSYRDIDQASCRIARTSMPPDTAGHNASLYETVVTIEPLGTYALQVFLRFCEDPRSLYGHE